MELPDTDPRMEEFQKHLHKQLNKYFGRDFTSIVYDEVKELVEHERIKFQLKYGCNFPKLIVLSLPTTRFLTILRADLDSRQIQTVIINMLQEFAAVGAPIDRRELAIAIHTAWPHYDPGEVIDLASNHRIIKPSLRN